MKDRKDDRSYMGMGVFTPGGDASPGTTIVGGQPDGQRREGVQDVPVGLEQVLLAAASDGQFRDQLLEDREAAVTRIGFTLVESERAILAAAPQGQLEVMIDRIDTSRANLERRDFMRAIAATIVSLAVGTSLQACAGPEDIPQGVDQPPFKGPVEPVKVPESLNMTTGGGARPDFPEPAPPMAGATIDVPDASAVGAGERVEVPKPPPNVKGGARPDLPEKKPVKIPVKPQKQPTRGHTLD